MMRNNNVENTILESQRVKLTNATEKNIINFPFSDKSNARFLDILRGTSGEERVDLQEKYQSWRFGIDKPAEPIRKKTHKSAEAQYLAQLEQEESERSRSVIFTDNPLELQNIINDLKISTAKWEQEWIVIDLQKSTKDKNGSNVNSMYFKWKSMEKTLKFAQFRLLSVEQSTKLIDRPVTIIYDIDVFTRWNALNEQIKIVNTNSNVDNSNPKLNELLTRKITLLNSISNSDANQTSIQLSEVSKEYNLNSYDVSNNNFVLQKMRMESKKNEAFIKKCSDHLYTLPQVPRSIISEILKYISDKNHNVLSKFAILSAENDTNQSLQKTLDEYKEQNQNCINELKKINNIISQFNTLKKMFVPVEDRENMLSRDTEWYYNTPNEYKSATDKLTIELLKTGKQHNSTNPKFTSFFEIKQVPEQPNPRIGAPENLLDVKIPIRLFLVGLASIGAYYFQPSKDYLDEPNTTPVPVEIMPKANPINTKMRSNHFNIKKDKQVLEELKTVMGVVPKPYNPSNLANKLILKTKSGRLTIKPKKIEDPLEDIIGK